MDEYVYCRDCFCPLSMGCRRYTDDWKKTVNRISVFSVYVYGTDTCLMFDGK